MVHRGGGGGEGMELLRSWGSLFLSFVIEVLNLRESKMNNSTGFNGKDGK